MQKPNVLFISSWYPSRENPTLGNFVQRHAEAIQPLANLYVVYAVSSEGNKEEFEIENAIVNGVNTTIVYYKKIYSKVPFYNSLLKMKRYRNGYKKGVEYIENKFKVSHFDITHCNVNFPVGLIALELKRKRGIPYVLSEHWTIFLPYRQEYDRLSFFKKYWIKKIIKNTDSILPVSVHLEESMKKKGFEGNYTVIPNVVDFSLFGLKYKKQDKKINILHVSTLNNEHKNFKGILDVIHNISQKRNDFQLTIVSDGNIEEAKKYQQKIGLSDEFINYENTKTPKEIAEIYKNSDFFILFSNYETFSVVIVEAWACGLPVVSSKCGGVTNIITDELGLVVTPNKVEELEKEVLEMMNSYETYSSEFIRKFALDKFSKKTIREQFLEVYTNTI